MQFYTTAQIGPKRFLTPEGFLVCQDVALARAGMQIYSAAEVYPEGERPAGLRPNDPVRVDRPEKEVFRPETIASFQGKILVNEHPEDNGERVDVTPDNWQRFAIGHVLNPRQGKGAESDLLLGDLMVTQRAAIEEILAGKKEISCGYDASYSPLSATHLEQRNIIGNHIALVESGRCGPRCAIRDHASDCHCDGKEPAVMKTGIFERIRDAFKTRDQQQLDAALHDAEQLEGQHVHLHVGGGPGAKEETEMHDAADTENPIQSLSKRVDAMESTLGEIKSMMADAARGSRDKRRKHKDKRKRDEDCEDDRRRDARHEDEDEDEDDRHNDSRHEDEDEEEEEEHRDSPPFGMEAPPGTGDRARRARDSQYFAQSFQDTVAVAEILAPGIGMPTFDSAARPKKTFDAMCNLRRQALSRAWDNAATREVIAPVMPSNFDGSFSGLSCEAIRPMFFAAGALKRQQNNQRATADGSFTPTLKTGGAPSIAEYNRKMSETWAKVTANGQHP